MINKSLRNPEVINQVDLVLIVLYELQERKKDQIRESTLHNVLYRLREFASPSLKFVTRPTVYIDQLESNLRLLEKKHLVSGSMILHDGFLPRYYYSLTQYGEVEVEELIEKLKIHKPDSMEAIVSNIQEYEAKTEKL